MENVKKKVVSAKKVMEVQMAEDGQVLVYCMLDEPSDLMMLVSSIAKALANFLISKKSPIEKPRILFPRA